MCHMLECVISLDWKLVCSADVASVTSVRINKKVLFCYAIFISKVHRVYLEDALKQNVPYVPYTRKTKL